MHSSARAIDDLVLGAVASTFAAARRPIVLAVSGGRDSMVMLDAVARAGVADVACVATFDHGSGDHATHAVALARREGASRGIRVVAGAAGPGARGEAAWRRLRWDFLQRVAREVGGGVATAHTLDDHLETVCMRILRDSGARGLAALLAPSPIMRPLLAVPRGAVIEYATRHRIAFVEDPTNASTAFLRNRVRRDLLPAIARVAPSFADEVLSLSERAARLRADVDAIASTLAVEATPGVARIDLSPLRRMTPASVELLVPALAARAGVIVDHRGTTRLAQFILTGRSGSRIPLSGGAEASRARDVLTIRRGVGIGAPEDEQPLDDRAVIGSWRFREVREMVTSDTWTAALPATSRLTVRRWRPGDRMRVGGMLAARRVKRFFGDAGISGPERIGWPVVLADGEIVWIPGVRRSDAATDRSGRPVLRYRCERNDV